MDHDSQDEVSYSRSLKRKADKHEAKILKKNKCRASKSKWTPEEDEILTKAVMMNGEGNWKKIAQSLNDRSHLQCLHRWQKVLNPALVKGPWKEEEDLKLVELVEKYGPKDWSTIASHIQGRIGKQCRERWFNHLSPEVRKTTWTPEEDQIIIDAHQRLGNKWTAISKLLNGRPANAIKNHWNSTLLKRIQMDNNGQGVIPRRERSKNKHKHQQTIGDMKDGTMVIDPHFKDESDNQSSPIPQSPIQIVPQPSLSSPISIMTNPISITVSTGQSSASGHAHAHSHPQDPSLILFGDQVLSWDWPVLSHSSSSSINHSVVPPSLVGYGSGFGAVTGTNMNFSTAMASTFNNSTNNNMGSSSVEYGLGLVEQSPDFMDLYQTQQSLSGLPELQFCFDSAMSSNSLSPSTPSLMDGSYSPMSLDTAATSTPMNMNMNLNMGLLNLEMPGFCPLQLDI
jgi:hypothetical protein